MRWQSSSPPAIRNSPPRTQSLVTQSLMTQSLMTQSLMTQPLMMIGSPILTWLKYQAALSGPRLIQPWLTFA